MTADHLQRVLDRYEHNVTVESILKHNEREEAEAANQQSQGAGQEDGAVPHKK